MNVKIVTGLFRTSVKLRNEVKWQEFTLHEKKICTVSSCRFFNYDKQGVLLTNFSKVSRKIYLSKIFTQPLKVLKIIYFLKSTSRSFKKTM